jgi:SAM-dependent methyltransferase
MLGTFRDPAGSLHIVHGRVIRVIRESESSQFDSLIASEAVRALVARGALVGTRALQSDLEPDELKALGGRCYEHDVVPFVSVPAEWSAAMLLQAALHTLDVCDELLRHGYVLKDATPANILFEGARPVFVDVPSIEPLRAGEDIWIPRHQFETTFLLPLMAVLEFGYPLRDSLADPAIGLPHEALARLFGARRWTNSTRIKHVALPAALGRAGGAQGARVAPSAPAHNNLERTRYVLSRTFSGLRKAVLRMAARIERRHSNWSAYACSRAHYADADLEKKREFVKRVLDRTRSAWVLDVGANTGEFSEMAADRAANVVAIDLDEVSVSAIYKRARETQKSIQPLVVDLSKPTPATGWRNLERRSFLSRAEKRFDLVLMLAVGHHLRVTAGVPLAQIIETGVSIGNGSLLFEFVPTDDPMFRTIARGREHLYSDNSVENCERLLSSHGRIQLRETLPNNRTLFWVSPRG